MSSRLGRNHQRTRARVIVGIAGGSAAGKTTLGRALAEALGPERVLHLQQDWYYRDLSHIEPEVRAASNFDHPEALEIELLRRHLRSLRRGETVRRPVYDFTTHTRLGCWHLLVPQEMVLVEGTLVLADPALRALLDICVYVDASKEIRLGRRLTRDVAQRGRDVGSCLEQHWRTVWPMHELYVGPSRCHAHVVVNGDAMTSESIAALARKVEEYRRLQERAS
jgi:uridine kinase